MSESFIISEKRLFAPVRLPGVDGYAHVDTGARYSSILQSHAGPFPDAGSREKHGALGSAVVPQVRIDEVVFLGEVFHDLLADVQPDTQGDLDTLPFTVVLALGCDLLLQKPLELDFDNSKLGFLEEDSPAAAEVVQLPASFSHGVPFFSVDLDGRTVNAVFDTGAGMSVLDQQLREALGDLLEDSEAVEVEDAAGSKHQIPTVRCHNLDVGEHRLSGCRFVVIDLGIVEQKTGSPVGLVFGLNAMMGSRWILDREQGAVGIMG